ncbi:putative receptor protein-tyrosine kinase CEPR1 [Cocos nucifera]|uniref:Putative receptor protein-tyrosine kinase CEPR1 n=1 Tax=Cocos nucifera TaxID=13894 RepID=A0A8K0MYM8_COCNU|nr:putative receptor protein-tyrosine kinase CEPR1 [Cocos nucifera]
MLSHSLLACNQINQLSDQIPPNFGDLCMLSRALLANNQISGPIPIPICSMALLANLDLVDNRIFGIIRSQGLEMLNLSQNLLEGEISEAFNSFANNDCLYGAPLPAYGRPGVHLS